MKVIKDSLQLREEFARVLLNDNLLHKQIVGAHLLISRAIKASRKILIFGNGGSAAEAQHFAAELVCMFEKKRRALPAIALTTDSSILTAQSNDTGFDSVFSRQIEALCQPGDVVIGLTTSDVYDDGHSKNILNAFKTAAKRGAKTVGLFSAKTKNLVSLVDIAVIVLSENTALIQEAHLAIIHIICKQIEDPL